MKKAKGNSKHRSRFTSFIRTIGMIALLIGLLFGRSSSVSATQIDIPGPAGSELFGRTVNVLPNGNFVITDSGFDISTPTPIQNVGAVYLYDAQTLGLISTLTGGSPNDRVSFNGITVLPNGNFLVRSSRWNNSMGAVTYCNGTTGCNGLVSAANSLVGSAVDGVGSGSITILTNGNYVVNSFNWTNGTVARAGAATLCDGASGCTGPVTAANSLVGTTDSDFVGQSSLALPNGNYVVNSNNWDNGTVVDAGAVTFCSGSTGCTGPVTAANSLIGGGAASFNERVQVLANGNYVVVSPLWDNIAVADTGAVTWCSGTTGCTGVVSASNSLVGTMTQDRVGEFGATALTNGNYVVGSTNWHTTNLGAATWCSGTSGCTGAVSAANSLVGSQSNDAVGGIGFAGLVVALSNGNYVVGSPFWRNAGLAMAGAATWCNGTGGCTGPVTTANSIVADQTGVLTGRVIKALTNGNYAVASYNWDNPSPALANVGAVTLCNGTTNGCASTVVSAANSLIGASAGDTVGFDIVPLTNGNFVANSPYWSNGTNTLAGAATLCNGITGCIGVVTAANSLVGTAANDGFTTEEFGGIPIITPVIALSNGNYVVSRPDWDNGTIVNAGSATWCSGMTGCTGPISASNSLAGDGVHGRQVGRSYVSALANGNYVVATKRYINGSVINAGAVTFGKNDGTTVGPVTIANSVLGLTSDTAVGPFILFTVDYDSANNRLLVGRQLDNTATMFQQESTNSRTPFDFDGDGRADISVFRPMPDPANNFWYIKQSSTGNTVAMEWGIQTDKLAPADYDGDGKTDIAVWRPNPGNPDRSNFYIVRSSDNTVRIEQFGKEGDSPAIVGDWDGDGKSDPAVFRPGTGGGKSFFFYRPSSQPGIDFTTIEWGVEGDVPLHGDFDGDGKLDAAVFRPSDNTWYIRQSSNGLSRYEKWGVATDKFVPADYDGDGKADLAVFRNGTWYIRQSSNNQSVYQNFGLTGDQLVPADYDGDGRADIALFRGGNWYVMQSQSGSVQYTRFGSSGDVAVPSAYQP